MKCAECGEEMWIADNGTAHHWGDGPEYIDYDRDADHVPYAEGGNE